jgi:hypothetical protein
MKRAVSQRSLQPIGAAAVLAAALCIPRASAAQGAPAPPEAAPAPSAPAETAPAQSAPPRAYPPPPPRYSNQAPPNYPQAPGYPTQAPTGYPSQAPSGYQAPPSSWVPSSVNQRRQWGYYPQVEGIYRPFSFTVGVGPGTLIGPGEPNNVAISYNLFRLGFGIASNLQFVLAFEGTGTTSVNPLTGLDSWLRQDQWLLGIQYYLVPRLYLRGGVGVGSVSEHTEFDSFDGGTGVAMAGAIGFEFVQTPHVALALDLNGSVTQYARERWKTAGVNLTLAFF